LPLVKLPEDHFLHPGMNDGVQTRQLRRLRKYDRCKPRSINSAAGISQSGSKLLQNLMVRGLTGLHQLVRQRVGVENPEAHVAEKSSNRALPASDPTG